MSQHILEVDSVLPREEFAARSAGLVQDAVASLGGALLDRAGRGDPVRENATETLGVTGPPDAVIGVLVVDTGRGPRARPWVPGAVAKELDRLRAGKLESFKLRYALLDSTGRPTGIRFDVEASPQGPDEPLARALTVRVPREWPGGGDAFEAWCGGFFRRAAIALDAVTGFVTYGDARGGSPYEDWAGSSFAFGLMRAHEQLRGYYWANLLAPSHVAAIGGLDTVRATVPDALVEPLTERGTPVLVELPGTPRTVPQRDLDALLEVFRPALAEPRPGFSDRPPAS